MTRVLLTFETLHKLLAAEKSLKQSGSKVRPTPTPPKLSESVCGMSLELLAPEKKDQVLIHLQKIGIEPKRVHELPD